jgi:cytochrome c biogenesis protein CcdA
MTRHALATRSLMAGFALVYLAFMLWMLTAAMALGAYRDLVLYVVLGMAVIGAALLIYGKLTDPAS